MTDFRVVEIPQFNETNVIYVARSNNKFGTRPHWVAEVRIEGGPENGRHYFAEGADKDGAVAELKRLVSRKFGDAPG